MSGALVELRREGELCVVTLSRPAKLNALSTALEQELREALASAEASSARCLVLTGSGRAFSAGADVSEFSERDADAALRYYRESGRVYEELAALPQPTISALHGYCLGGGLELALATDLRVADETAVFGFPEVGIGILPSSGGTTRATRVLGPARAKELIMLGRRLAARQALEFGLVSEVVAEGRALERALEVGHTLAALPATALAVVKQVIDAAADSPHSAATLIERLAYGVLVQTAAAREAADEFVRR